MSHLIISANSDAVTGPSLAPDSTSTASPVLQQIFGDVSQRSDLSEPVKAALYALAKESHDPLLFPDLMELGRQLEAGGQPILAEKVYTAVQSQAPQKDLRHQAAQALQVLQGHGNLGQQLEFHTQRFLPRVTDPGIILPMMAGSLAYQVGKTAALVRMAGRSNPGWWSHGFGARATAASAGFVGEVGAFSLAGRGMQVLAGAEVLWDKHSLSQELQSTALTLGILKVFSFAGTQGMLRFRKLNELGSPALISSGDRLAMNLSGHGSGYLGLVSAHGAEAYLGLREPMSGGNLWLEALSTHLALRLGSRLGHGVSGKSLATLQQSLGWQMEIYSNYVEGRRRFEIKPQWTLAMAMAGNGNGNGEGDASFNGGFPPSSGNSGRRAPRPTPVGVRHRIIQGVTAAIPPGWSTIKPVNLWLELETGGISASRPNEGKFQKITLAYRGAKTGAGLWKSRWMLSEESFTQLVRLLANRPSEATTEVLTEAIKALATTDQVKRYLAHIKQANRKTGPMASFQFRVPKRATPTPPPPMPPPASPQGPFRGFGVYHTIQGYATVHPLAQPELARDARKVFRVQVNAPNMVAPFEPDPSGSSQLWIVPWAIVKQIDAGKTPKNTIMMQLHVEHEVGLKGGDWVEIVESSPWHPRPFSGQVISRHYDGDVNLYAIRDLAASTDPAMTFRVQGIRKILDEENRWDSDRLVLVPHKVWGRTRIPGENFHPLEVLLTDKQFPVKEGQWVQVEGEWGPRPIPGVGYTRESQAKINLYTLSGYDALAENSESVFRVEGHTVPGPGAPTQLILVHHSMWQHPNAKRLYVNLNQNLELHMGDWVGLKIQGEWESR